MFNLNTLDKIAKENVSHTFKIKEIIVFFYTICIKKKGFFIIYLLYIKIYFSDGDLTPGLQSKELQRWNSIQEMHFKRDTEREVYGNSGRQRDTEREVYGNSGRQRERYMEIVVDREIQRDRYMEIV